MNKRSLFTVAAVAWKLCSARIVLSQPLPVQNQAPLCELQIDGHSIQSLTLLGDSPEIGLDGEYAGTQRFLRPGKSVLLPAGRYHVLDVTLEGGFEAHENFLDARQWIDVSPDTPCKLAIGAPLSPRVSVQRHGRFLEMDCDLVDAGGRSYVASDGVARQAPPPAFTVYKDGQVLGSGSFEYG